jgi:flagellar protein FlaG
MSVVQSGADLSLANLTPELKKPVEASDNTGNMKLNELVELKKEQAVSAELQAQDQSDQQKPLTPEQLDKVAQQLQDFVGEMNRGLEFLVDKDSGRDVIKVIDKTSGDLVKQFPSEEVLTLVAKLSEMVGGFIDAKV